MVRRGIRVDDTKRDRIGIRYLGISLNVEETMIRPIQEYVNHYDLERAGQVYSKRSISYHQSFDAYKASTSIGEDSYQER